MSLSIPEGRPRTKRGTKVPSIPSDVAACTANVSYSSQVTGDEIKEAPVTMLARMVEQLNSEAQADRSTVWSNMRKMARKMARKMHVSHSIFS